MSSRSNVEVKEKPKRKMVKKRVVIKNVNNAEVPVKQPRKRDPEAGKVNGSYYRAIRKKILSLRSVVYDIDEKYHIDIQQSYMTLTDLNEFIKNIIKDDENTKIDTNHQ